MSIILESDVWRNNPFRRLDKPFFSSKNPYVKRALFRTLLQNSDSIYESIIVILDRLDESLHILETTSEEYDTGGDSKTTPGVNIDLPFYTDVITFYLFINLLLDSIARLINYVLRPKDPDLQLDFQEVKNILLQGGIRGIETDSIFQDIDWYQRINYLNSPVIQESDKRILRNNGEIWVHIGYFRDEKLTREFLSTRTINEHCIGLHDFVDEICKFLEEHVDELPLKENMFTN